MTRSRGTVARIAGTLTLATLCVATGRADDQEVSAIGRPLDTRVENGNRKDLDAFLDDDWYAPGVVFQSGRVGRTHHRSECGKKLGKGG